MFETEKERNNDGDRKFYDFQDPYSLSQYTDMESRVRDEKQVENESDKMFELIRNNEIGREAVFNGPFGLRKIVYCDYTASGRPLKFIEEYINDEVLTDYGNTHTTTTVTSLQMTLYRNEAKDIIRNCVNASEHDCVIFTGSGCTGAVHKLINGLNLKESPIVFVSSYEHHSNLLPWREITNDVIVINERDDGTLDLNDLEEKLKEYSTDKYASKLKIGSFSAASNITGILTNVNEVAVLMHLYDGLVFFDYATAAPYTDINMNPVIENISNIELGFKDAVFISTHKFVGGTQTPGILIAKKKLFTNRVPNGSGGGTVFFVTDKDHRYLKNEEMREEGGTLAIVESIRAGMIFQLKRACGVDNIMERENRCAKKAIEFLKNVKNLHILGGLCATRLPIFSFLIENETTGLYLHHNFVSALLNDLFGIQTRSGCACAGPYAQNLLGLNYELAKTYENILINDNRFSDKYRPKVTHEYSQSEIMRPGFTRFNLTYFMTDETIDFILNAIKFVCEHGWKFLPFYNFNLETGEWRHRNHQVFKDRKWLGYISYKNGEFRYTKRNNYKKEEIDSLYNTYTECLELAKNIVDQISKQKVQLGDQMLVFDQRLSNLRWFLLPSEAFKLLSDSNNTTNKRYDPPFVPKSYPTGDYRAFIELKRLDENILNMIDTSLMLKNEVRFIKDLNNDELTKVQVVLGNMYVDDEYKKSENAVCLIKNNKKYEVFETKIKNIKEKLENGINKNETVSPKCERLLKNKTSDETTFRWYAPPKPIFKPFIEAVTEFNMIQNNDKVLLCLSGGKDSLSLLHTLRQYQFVCKSKGIEFEFGAVTVDPKTSSYDPSPLKKYLAQLNVPYHYEEQEILDTAKSLPYECASICSFCSRMKRGRFYHTARTHGYNVIAIGQHLDDIVESFMMSLFYNGKLWTMKAHYKNENEDLRIIRPLIYVRENDLRQFAESSKLPIITENCPGCFESPKERHRIKQLLAQNEAQFPFLYNSLLSAIKPLIKINKCQISMKTLSEHCLRLINENTQLYESLKDNKSSKDDDDDTN